MPSAKYYRSIIPLDLLQIIGNYAGDDTYKLVFTLSPKRKFLSNIILKCRNLGNLGFHRRDQVILKSDSWVPMRLNCIPEILCLLNQRSKLPKVVVKDSLRSITLILLEIHDYNIKQSVRTYY